MFFFFSLDSFFFYRINSDICRHFSPFSYSISFAAAVTVRYESCSSTSTFLPTFFVHIFYSLIEIIFNNGDETKCSGCRESTKRKSRSIVRNFFFSLKNFYLNYFYLIFSNYHADNEGLINRQINLELYASYVYTAMSHHFDRHDVALKG